MTIFNVQEVLKNHDENINETIQVTLVNKELWEYLSETDIEMLAEPTGTSPLPPFVICISGLEESELEPTKDNVPSGQYQADNVQEGYLQADNVQDVNVQDVNVQAVDVQAGDVQESNIRAVNVQAVNVQADNVQADDVQAGYVQSDDVMADNVQVGNSQAGRILYAVFIEFKQISNNRWLYSNGKWILGEPTEPPLEIAAYMENGLMNSTSVSVAEFKFANLKFSTDEIDVDKFTSRELLNTVILREFHKYLPTIKIFRVNLMFDLLCEKELKSCQFIAVKRETIPTLLRMGEYFEQKSTQKRKSDLNF